MFSIPGAIIFGASAAGSALMSDRLNETHVAHIMNEQIKRQRLVKPMRPILEDPAETTGPTVSRERLHTPSSPQTPVFPPTPPPPQTGAPSGPPPPPPPQTGAGAAGAGAAAGPTPQPKTQTPPFTSQGTSATASHGQESHTFGVGDMALQISKSDDLPGRLSKTFARQRIKPETARTVRKDGGRYPTVVGDQGDGSMSSNQVTLVQVSNASYLKELNKYNTSF